MHYKGYKEPQYNTPDHLLRGQDIVRQLLIDDFSIHVKQLANAAHVSQGIIRGWMTDWKKQGFNYGLEEGGDIVKLTPKTKKKIVAVVDKYDLDNKEELFVFHYLKTFNATTAAARAGYPTNNAHNAGYKLMKKPNIRKALVAIKAERDEELLVDSMDIIKQYVKIAFADITDVVMFKGTELQLRSSTKVDGQLINEIKQGKDGISVKLIDKIEALKRLERYFFLMPDQAKIEIEKEKFKLQKAKLLLDIQQAQKTTITKDNVGILKEKMLARKKKVKE